MSVVADVTGLVVTLILVRGLGQGTLSVLSLALPGKWFTRRLGPAMGVFAVLLAFGFIAATLAVGAVRHDYGWRIAWAAVGASLLCGLAPVSWLLVRDSPEACGIAGEEEQDKSFLPAPLLGTGRGEADFTLLQALRSPAFWTFGLATAHFGLLWSAITLFNEAILAEHGFDAQTFYAVMGLLTLGGLATNLLGGWLTTFWPLGRLLFVGMVCLAAALVAFPFVHSLSEVLAYGFVLGMAGGLITVVHFTFYGKTFGRTHLGKIQGAAQVLSVLTSALGPIVLALVKEWTRSYDLFFYGSAPLAVLLGLAAWYVPVPRRAATGEEST
jgi:sugar phosphate permease